MEFFNQIKSNVKASGLCFPVLLTALALTGGFSEFFSCVIAAVASVMLIVCAVRGKGLRLRFSARFVAVLTVAGFYLLTSFYGVDGGEAFIGFVKFLPVVLFAVLLMQNSGYAASLRELIPYIAAALGLISLPLMLIPSLGFSVDGRLGGFFQYPNTFAMFLLIGFLLLLSKPEKKTPDIVCAILLFTLIILTASRAVFVLTLIAAFILLLKSLRKKGRIILICAVVVLAAAVLLLYPTLKEIDFVNRFLSLSVFESTFAGRLLYWRDAMPLILRHPFGMGYLGYYFTEQSVQTGVYSVRFIHNDMLQLLLDVGWVPALTVLFAILRSVFSKKTGFADKVIIVTFLLHICFDFDLQFTAMWFILLILLDDGVECPMRMKSAASVACAAISLLLSAYFAVALGLGFFGAHNASLSMYPLNTEERAQILTQTEDSEKMNSLADYIIKQNKYVQVAYSAKAQYALEQGDVESLMKYKHKIFEVAPFDYSEYEDYAAVLIYCIGLYQQSGDEESAQVCQKELLSLRDKLNGLEQRLSYFGKIIKDQPQTAFTDEINSYIDAIG